ncbi:MAG TPA: YlxR family protein [Methylomirabilota bacterium]|jgi:predicted RNA-binding protein YlxR (DUF448 family)|nr:YlxR family protein [Methylomirabilota bacterium]
MTTTSCPTRTCVGCRRRRPKAALLRLVRRPDGRVDADAAGPGRGAYVCADAECLERALKPGRLAHAFRKPSEARTDLIDTVVFRR